ncbi:MAG: lysozyme inhibitor LprI family protein [Hyphomicrobiaceae bacterium]
MTHLVSASLAGATIALLVLSTPASAHQPGAINCSYAMTKTAHAVCASRRLSRANETMNQLFDDARDLVTTRVQMQSLHADQRTWAAKRDRCGSFRFCIWFRTKLRIKQLDRFMRRIDV